MGVLRRICKKTMKKLNGEKLKRSKLELLSYSPEELRKYLLRPLKFSSIQEAYDAKYHIDHIVPIWLVAKNIENKILAFKVSMDKENLRLIPGKINSRKQGKINLLVVQEKINHLNKKYSVNLLTI